MPKQGGNEVNAKKERAKQVAACRPQIKQFNTERYESKADGNQPQADEFNEFLEKLGIMADWLDNLLLRIDRRRGYLELMNAWGGHDDLAMEIRDFHTACRGLTASYRKKRRAA
jgi:hypothetical protein